jgi:GTP diphosphokinase / guanosine-3',5'-bis(diphosphate) 3'-diphosphatase
MISAPRRLRSNEEPYAPALTAEATEGKNPELVIAVLLHDSIEDHEVPRSAIAESFGEEVARLRR